MASELLLLGLLDGEEGREEYLRILRRFSKTEELKTEACGVLIKILEVGDTIFDPLESLESRTNDREAEISPGNSLIHAYRGERNILDAYQNLFQNCLIPRLQKILSEFSGERPVVENRPNESLNKSVNDDETEDIGGKLQEIDDGMCLDSSSVNDDKRSLEPNPDEILLLVSKLSHATALILRKLDDAGRSCVRCVYLDSFSSCVESKNSISNGSCMCGENTVLMKRIFDSIAHSIFRIQDGEYYKLKAIALIHATMLRGEGGKKVIGKKELEESIRSIIHASLVLIGASSDNKVGAVLLTLVMQPYMDLSKENVCEIIKSLWSIVINFYTTEQDFIVEEKNTTGFMILCFMVDYILCDDVFHHTGIGGDDMFWQIVSFGLIHPNPLSRKRSQYILKRCVDYYTLTYPENNGQVSEYLVWPEQRNQELVKLWNDYFLLLETLEEKQVHVIKPILENFDKLIISVCKKDKLNLHPSWLLVIFKRIFDHDNKNIRQWGVCKMLEFKWPGEVLAKGFFSFTITYLLQTLSDYSLYGKDLELPSKATDQSCQNTYQSTQTTSHPSRIISLTGEKISVYVANTLNSLNPEQRQSFMTGLLRAIFDGRSWGSIPLYYLIRSLACAPDTCSWTYTDVKQAVINFEHCLSTQEVVLRSASQCDLLRAIFKHLAPNTTFLQLCDIIGKFRRRESWCRGSVIWHLLVNGLDSFKDTWEERKFSLRCVIVSAITTTSITTTTTTNTDTHSPSSSSLGSISKESKSVCGESETHLTDSMDTLSLNPSAVTPTGLPSSLDIALGVNLLLDSTPECQQIHIHTNWVDILTPINNFLKDCHIRPYLEHRKFIWVVETLTHVLEIRCDLAVGSSSETNNTCDRFSLLSEGTECLMQLFIQEMRKYTQPHDLDVILLHLNLYRQCNNVLSLRSVLLRHYPELLRVCTTLMKYDNTVKSYFGILLLEHLLQHYYDSSADHIKREMMLLCSEKIITNMEAFTQRRQITDYATTEFTKKLLMELTRSCWSCVELMVNKGAPLEEGEDMCVRKGLKEVLMRTITTAARRNVLHVFQVAVSLSSDIIQDGVWEDVVEVMWRTCAEFRKSCDLHRSLISCLTCLLYHNQVLSNPHHHKTIILISKEMLSAGESTQGISSVMAHSLSTSLVTLHSRGDLDPACVRHLVCEVFVPLVMFGSVFRKQYRVIRDTVLFVRACGDVYSTNILVQSDCDSETRTRVISLRYLLTLKDDVVGKEMAGVLAEGIQHHYRYSGGDRRDYSNSQNHRYKTRLLQSLLIIIPLLNQSECVGVLEWLGRGISQEHQQPSVRYLQEWGASLLTILHPHLYTQLIHHFNKGIKQRVGCVGSFLAALTHVACCSEDAHLLCSAVQHTLPWCMAQHFNTRLYAQVSLRKMWQHCDERGVVEVLERYGPVQQCLQFVVQQGNAARNTTNMLNDFYFRVFHPLKHYTLQTILHDLPCLSLLAGEEWVSPAYLRGVASVDELPLHSLLPLHNPDTLLIHSSPAPWVVKAAGEKAPCEVEEDEEGEKNNFQRKITPWKSMVREITTTTNLTSLHEVGTHRKRSKLILVASLLEKAANLGGLCRTCEVFGVRHLVVSSLAVKDDNTFTALSLTSHQWLPMKEVKMEGLAGYLKELQTEGYTLVGAEQSTQSVSLSNYKFPERTALILGNEREGIQCELLQLLDVCVEIPQSGVIRSLNVHVSGALLTWEYTQQHLHTHTST